MAAWPRSVSRLIDCLERFPGVGPKSAQRLALWLLREPAERSLGLAEAIREAVEQTRLCEICGHFSEAERCPLCLDPRRRDDLLCVVADSRELLAIEATGDFTGRYHVLGGVLSPIDGVGPEELTIARLLQRLQDATIDEVIVALNPTPEGDTTANYLARLIKPAGIRVTRPALGLPVGGDLTYADRVTLERALEGRREL